MKEAWTLEVTLAINLKMSIFEMLVTWSLFQKFYSHIDSNSGEKFEDMFLFKMASKGTFLS